MKIRVIGPIASTGPDRLGFQFMPAALVQMRDQLEAGVPIVPNLAFGPDEAIGHTTGGEIVRDLLFAEGVVELGMNPEGSGLALCPAGMIGEQAIAKGGNQLVDAFDLRAVGFHRNPSDPRVGACKFEVIEPPTGAPVVDGPPPYEPDEDEGLVGS